MPSARGTRTIKTQGGICAVNQWRKADLEGLGDSCPPVGSRGEAPVGDLRDEVPLKLKNFY